MESGNFSALQVKKIIGTPYCRIALNYADRLLVQFARFGDEQLLLLLEYISEHNYARSRFLNGVAVDESKLIEIKNPADAVAEGTPMPYVNPGSTRFYYPGKPLSFDQQQEQVMHTRVPLIIIGSAGSGKTALTLERMKVLKGNVMYVTLSSFLAQHATTIYFSGAGPEEEQDAEFLSFREYVESIQVPQGREITFRVFEQWFSRHRNFTTVKDAHKLFEEFGGVIAGSTRNLKCMDYDEYMKLGARRSVFKGPEREEVYALFVKYVAFLREQNLYDLNLVSHDWLDMVEPKYDFVVVDEVQDLTIIQMDLIMRSLKKPGNFILCGDANQVVHPNFFSWAGIKTYFYEAQNHDNLTLSLLQTNYRNSPMVTQLSNRLLKARNVRFGSIDKESTFLLQAVSGTEGETKLFGFSQKTATELNNRTMASARVAVIVLRNEDKAEARKWFKSPLLFSIHEVKGLEYESVILFNLISACKQEFSIICSGIDPKELDGDEVRYSRSRDKFDDSSEVYKFYINGLYVALTRSTSNVYFLEERADHEMFELLNLKSSVSQMTIQTARSSQSEWRQEVIRLEQQGKQEQADDIRRMFFEQIKPVTWEPVTSTNIGELMRLALDKDNFNKKAKDKLFDYALMNELKGYAASLAQSGYKRALQFDTERGSLFRKHYAPFLSDQEKMIEQEIKKYGVDYRDAFNLTPLMAASMTGAVKIVHMLLRVGADKSLNDNFGKTPFQHMLVRFYHSKAIGVPKFSELFHLLKPDHIKFRAYGRQVKIDQYKADFLMVNVMISLQSAIIASQLIFQKEGINAKILETFLELIPDSILPEHRKQRTYINAHLARHELNSKASSGKKLYLRFERGHYVINPDLEIYIGDEWRQLHELMQFETMFLEAKIHKLADLIAQREAFLNDSTNFDNKKNSPYVYMKNLVNHERLQLQHLIELRNKDKKENTSAQLE